MRLEDWQKFIESQFLDDEPEAEVAEETKPEPSKAEPPKADTFRHEPLKPVAPPPAPASAVPLVAPKPTSPAIIGEPNRPANVPPQAPPIANYRAPSGTGEPARLPQPPTEKAPPKAPNLWSMETEAPAFNEYLAKKPAPPPVDVKKMGIEANPFLPLINESPPDRPRRTVKYRAKHAKNVRPELASQGLSIVDLWERAPRHIEKLVEMGRRNDEEVAQYSYKRPFAEQRKELIERILDPVLSLEDTARLLNVCPTTVRRYTNRGILNCYRKEVENSSRDANGAERETRQRRFRLSDILVFLEAQQQTLDADRKADSARLYPTDGAIEDKD